MRMKNPFSTKRYMNSIRNSVYSVSEGTPEDTIKGGEYAYKYKVDLVKAQKTVYFAAGWFTDKQNKAYKDAILGIERNATIDRENSYVPLEHQYKGLRVDEHPELLEDKEWATATFNGDYLGIKASDIFLCTYVPGEEDVGCGVELGLAKSLGKYIVVVIPDEDYGKSINLMTWGVADKVIKMSELESLDFNKPEFSFYEGAVY